MSVVLAYVLTVLAAHRVYRLLGVDEFPPIAGPRHRLEERVRKRHGDDWAAGLRCSWCSGSWCGLVAAALVHRYMPIPLPALWYLAVAGGVGLLGAYESKWD